MKILLVEDDSRISDFLVKGLQENGFTVMLATSGEQARNLLSGHTWDLILMDIMLPGINGIELTKLLRFKSNQTPVMMLSAIDNADDKVAALDGGADDYLVKPFHFKELLSRINALTRRTKMQYQKSIIYNCKSLSVQVDAHEVKVKDQPVTLSPREYRLLVFLIDNRNTVLSRSQILSTVWGINYENSTNVVDVYISYLRNKIESNDKFIYTVKGTGYMFKEL